MRLPSKVRFVNEEFKKAFTELQHGDDAERRLSRQVLLAIYQIEQDAFAGRQLRKELIPKSYEKYRLDNLWKYDLADGWRLLYTIRREEVLVITIILEWMPHREYEKRFKY